MIRKDGKQDLETLLRDCEGCVVYGAGLVGTCLIQYLMKRRMASKLVCIAVKNRGGNPGNVMGIPVCELKELESYKERYIFLIATMEHLQDGIGADLEEFGCKKIIGISNLCYAAIREETFDFGPDILSEIRNGMAVLNNKLEEVIKAKEELVYLIEEQNEISDINTKAFAEYQNYFRGKDIVIVATGPTMNEYKPIENAVHIGVNTAYKNPNIALDFLFVQDGRPSTLGQKYLEIEKVNCRIFMGRVLKRSPFEYTEFPEKYRLQKNVTDFILAHNFPKERIYRNICHHPVSGDVTVTFSAIQFALYTYPKRIFLVGCDSLGATHFDGSVDTDGSIGDGPLSTFREKYQMMKEFAQMHYPDTEMISINPVGLKGIFRDEYM